MNLAQHSARRPTSARARPAPPPPRRAELCGASSVAGDEDRGGDSCSPFFAPLTDKELQKLKEAKVAIVPMRLRAILRKHYTPIRHLFRCFNGNQHGTLTKLELQKSLKCLGIELQKWEVDHLFRASAGLDPFAADRATFALLTLPLLAPVPSTAHRGPAQLCDR